jgi:hypothetical protein
MSLNKLVRQGKILSARSAANGTLTACHGFEAGASGSCALTDTSLYTYTFPRAFSVAPVVVAAPETASVRLEVSSSTTGATVRSYSYNGTTKTAAIHDIIVIGRQTGA